MRVQSLEAFGVHRDLLRAWENNYSKKLLPVQAEAACAGKVLAGTSLIAYAPTGAGKTIVGEMEAMHAATVLYGADLIDAAVGALIGGALLVPLLGTLQIC